jgi:DNA-binding response OmpR family regulator
MEAILSDEHDRKPRVLIVEDEALIALETSTHLADWGYEVSGIATSVSDALQQAERAPPDLALIDVNLAAGGDGVAAARELRTRYGAPVVFVTGQADQESRSRMKAVGAVGCIFKPYDPRTLQAIVRNVLN